MVKIAGVEFDNYELAYLGIIFLLVVSALYIGISFLFEMKWVLAIAVASYVVYWYGKEYKKKKGRSILEELGIEVLK